MNISLSLSPLSLNIRGGPWGGPWRKPWGRPWGRPWGMPLGEPPPDFQTQKFQNCTAFRSFHGA